MEKIKRFNSFEKLLRPECCQLQFQRFIDHQRKGNERLPELFGRRMGERAENSKSCEDQKEGIKKAG